MLLLKKQTTMYSLHYQIENSTCCGSQAIISTYFNNEIDLLTFEIFTTVPFGIVHKYKQTNRLIESIIDHDIGIQRALKTLNINYEKATWKNNSDIREVIKLLKEWSRKQAVIIGPLNMDGLPYLFYNNLYKKMNHYLIVLGFDGSNFLIADTEGYNLVKIRESSLIDAWRGDRIIEGNGAFIMQRIEKQIKFKINTEMWIKTLQLAIQNYKQSISYIHGSGKALIEIYDKQYQIKSDFSLKNRLTYDLPLRIQRNILIDKFANSFKLFFNNVKLKLTIQNLTLNIKTQNKLYAIILLNILEKKTINFDLFKEISKLENDLANIFFQLNSYIK